MYLGNIGLSTRQFNPFAPGALRGRSPCPVRMAGAVLLALVVVKRFLLDLVGSGTVARIVSFIRVGVMMLAIGYLAPRAAAATDTRSLNDATNRRQ
nr:DUF2339 domain-containing protein [uncultured Thiodictyon sp.]